MLTGTNRVELYSWPTRPFQGPVSSLWGKKHGSWPPTFWQVSQALPVRPPWWPSCRAKSDGPLGSTPEMVSLGAFPPREQMSGRVWKDTVALGVWERLGCTQPLTGDLPFVPPDSTLFHPALDPRKLTCVDHIYLLPGPLVSPLVPPVWNIRRRPRHTGAVIPWPPSCGVAALFRRPSSYSLLH